MARTAARIALALAAVGLALAPAALAEKGGNRGGGPKQSSAQPLALVSERVWNSPNPAAPTWCLNEDDWHQRTWIGSLSGSFAVTEQLCGTSADYSAGIWWDAGGIGLQADLYVTGTLTGLTITSPQGDSHQAVVVGSNTSKGVTTDHYQVCYVPPFSVTYNVGGTPLSGGTWQLALTGNIANATLTVTAEMADAPFQQQRCPASQQNLVP